MVGVVEVGVVDIRYSDSQPGADAERYRCACLHWGRLGVVTGINAASTGGVLVIIIIDTVGMEYIFSSHG